MENFRSTPSFHLTLLMPFSMNDFHSIRFGLMLPCIVAGLFALIGCGTVDHSVAKYNPKTWFSSENKNTIPENSTEVAEATEENPFLLTGEPEVKTASAKKTMVINEEVQTPKFDAATMMLIETEFRDATPEERKQWYEELRQVPPDMVPRIIRMRRLARQHSEDPSPVETRKVAGHPSSETSNELPVIADHSQSSASANELQALDPWNRPAVGRSQPQNLQPGEMVTVSNQQPEAIDVGKVQTADGIKTESLSPQKSNKPVMETVQKSDKERYEEALATLINLSEQQIQHNLPAGDNTQMQKYTRDHVFLRMMYLMSDRHERTLEAIPDLPAAEQEFWQKLFWGMSNYFDATGIPNSGDRATHAVSQLSDATDRLRERANLEIRNVTFSRGIQGFGVYDRFERDEFRPGQPVLVYGEMRNFLSEMTPDGTYKTVLKSTVEIHRAGSNPGLVVEQEYPPTEDYCRTRRHDYFHSYKVNIPSELTVGPYLLKLIVEDQLNRKVATYSINFTVK